MTPEVYIRGNIMDQDRIQLLMLHVSRDLVYIGQPKRQVVYVINYNPPARIYCISIVITEI